MRTPLLAIAACLMLAGTSFAAETAIAWGYNNHGQCNVPAGETFVQVAAGEYHTIGLRADGTAIACGLNSDGQCNVPAGETFVHVAAGGSHTIGFRSDGTAIAWGNNDFGQCNAPAGVTFVQVDAGTYHNIGLREDGAAIAWGWNNTGQCNVPAGETFVQVAAGGYHTIGLRGIPTGACCVNAGCDPLQSQDQCTNLGGSWAFAGSCDDCTATCAGDVNNDGTVNVLDLLGIIDGWGICD